MEVKVMILTEQTVHNDNFNKIFKNEGCRAYFNYDKRNVPNIINSYLGKDRFKNSVIKKGSIYWSHAIKFPLKNSDDRSKVINYFLKKETIQRDLKSRGNAWILKREIEILQPLIIISFGSSATSLLYNVLFVNENFSKVNLWERVKRELEDYKLNDQFGFIINNIRVIVLYHPSGRNAAGKAVNEFFKNKLVEMIENEMI